MLEIWQWWWVVHMWHNNFYSPTLLYSSGAKSAFCNLNYSNGFTTINYFHFIWMSFVQMILIWGTYASSTVSNIVYNSLEVAFTFYRSQLNALSQTRNYRLDSISVITLEHVREREREREIIIWLALFHSSCEQMCWGLTTRTAGPDQRSCFTPSGSWHQTHNFVSKRNLDTIRKILLISLLQWRVWTLILLPYEMAVMEQQPYSSSITIISDTSHY